MDGSPFSVNYYLALQVLAAIVLMLIFASSVDDLFIDLWYWSRRIYRSLTIEQRFARMTTSQLRKKNEQLIAIVVPAWMEYDVISAMIEKTVKVLEYQNYAIFVGAYVNDVKTTEAVERLCRRYKQLHRVEVPHAGPICKADCLNWVVDGVLSYERENSIQFAGVVLHDCDDVLHPLELKFFNFLLPRKDMIQLPVSSLEREWHELVAGTYMDEFAESHAKDMVVRESMAGVVPSAGTGTCFSRRALHALVAVTHSKPFNIASPTEDYDVGIRLAQLNMSAVFGVFPVNFRVDRKSWKNGNPKREQTVCMPLSVRKLFPDTFRQAYRQKAGRELGVGLQSWAQIKWPDTLAARYLLLRDRKSIVMAFVTALAYLLAAHFIVIQVGVMLGWWTLFPPSLFAGSSLLQTLLYLSAMLLLVRCAHRFYFTTVLYGWVHGLMSLPRLVVGHVINFMAVARAWRLYRARVGKGSTQDWDKTMHDFPADTRLLRRRQRLGELLLFWQAVEKSKLDKALLEQAATQMPLGTVLVSNGWLDEETLAEAIAYQTELPRAHLNADMVRRHAGGLPLDFGTRYRAVYIGRDVQNRPLLAVASPIPDEALAEVQVLLGKLPGQRIARESEIAIALRLLRGASETFEKVQNGVAGVPLLGDMLIEQGLIKRAVFESAMQTYRPDQHGRVGDYLVQQGVILRHVMERVVSQQRLMHEEVWRALPQTA